MRKLLAIALSVAFSGSAMAAELDTCSTTLGKIPINDQMGTNEEKLDACVQWLFNKVKTGSHGKFIGTYRRGIEIIKWQNGSAWTYGHCYVHKGDALFTLNTVSPIDSKPGEANKACLAQTPIWTMLGDVIAEQ